MLDSNVPLFLFQTCIGSGPESPCLYPECEDLGIEALFPLAVLATSRGRNAGGMTFPTAAVFVATSVSHKLQAS